VRSPRYRFLTDAERYQAIEDHVLAATEVVSEEPRKRARRKRAPATEEFELQTWRLPEKYRKRYSPRGLDLSDSAIAKMTKGCSNPGTLEVR
jgi:hypothetical protein